MTEYLYEVRISRGQNHPEQGTFQENVTPLNTKAGYDRIDSVYVLKLNEDTKTVQLICSDGMRDDQDVTAKEITSGTLTNQHRQ